MGMELKILSCDYLSVTNVRIFLFVPLLFEFVVFPTFFCRKFLRKCISGLFIFILILILISNDINLCWASIHKSLRQFSFFDEFFSPLLQISLLRLCLRLRETPYFISIKSFYSYFWTVFHYIKCTMSKYSRSIHQNELLYMTEPFGRKIHATTTSLATYSTRCHKY